MVKPSARMEDALFWRTLHQGYVSRERQWKPCSITSLLLPSSGPALAADARVRPSVQTIASSAPTNLFLNMGVSPRVRKAAALYRFLPWRVNRHLGVITFSTTRA